MARTDFTRKTVTVVPAHDTISPHQGKQGTVVADGISIFPSVLLAGHDNPVRIHRAFLVIIPTPGMIEVDPRKLFDKLVDAYSEYRMPYHAEFLRGIQDGKRAALFEVFCDLTGEDPETTAEAVNDAVTARHEESLTD